MVVPYVQGVQQNGVAACVKHYALNNQEVNRHTTNVIVDDRALYEIYLPAFKAAVQEGNAWPSWVPTTCTRISTVAITSTS